MSYELIIRPTIHETKEEVLRFSFEGFSLDFSKKKGGEKFMAAVWEKRKKERLVRSDMV